jgi:hypothetical protein
MREQLSGHGSKIRAEVFRMPVPGHSFRPARREDAAILAQLVNIAGEGLPLYLWGNLAGPGETAWDVGRQRAAREEGSFSYRNATVIENDGVPAGCLIGYEIAHRPDPIPPHAENPPGVAFGPTQDSRERQPSEHGSQDRPEHDRTEQAAMQRSHDEVSFGSPEGLNGRAIT